MERRARIPVGVSPYSAALAFDGSGTPHVGYLASFRQSTMANYMFRGNADTGW
jgi:hypothetical protein